MEEIADIVILAATAQPSAELVPLFFVASMNHRLSAYRAQLREVDVQEHGGRNVVEHSDGAIAGRELDAEVLSVEGRRAYLVGNDGVLQCLVGDGDGDHMQCQDAVQKGWVRQQIIQGDAQRI